MGLTVNAGDGVRLGIALGSGSAKAWAHVGILRALREASIVPQVVCGSSAGAFVGAAYVTGNLDTLAEWGSSLSARDVVSLLDPTLSSGGVLAGERMMKFLRASGRDSLIEKLPCAYAATATELNTGRELWLQSGSLVRAVRASMAFPGLLTPVCVEGRWLVDGGLVNPVPVSLCRALGADVVIAVNLNSELVAAGRDLSGENGSATEKSRDGGSLIRQKWAAKFQELKLGFAGQARKPEAKAPGVFDVLVGSLHIMQDRITRSRLAGDPPDIVLTPRLPGVRLMDFDKAAYAIERGVECVGENLELIGAELRRWEGPPQQRKKRPE